MEFYDLIKVNSILTFHYIYDEDDFMILRTSFSKKIIESIERKENKKFYEIFKRYFFEKKPLPQVKYKLPDTITKFEKEVLEETKKIKFGKTSTYKEISERIGRPKAYRAVGNALGKNPLPVIIPCHRVLSSNGLGGFTGGIEIKKFLLNLES